MVIARSRFVEIGLGCLALHIPGKLLRWVAAHAQAQGPCGPSVFTTETSGQYRERKVSIVQPATR